MKTVAIWLLFVLALSVLPIEGGAKVPQADKIMHFIMYAITCVLFFSVLAHKMPFRKALILSVLLSVGYGAVMEVIQAYMPPREFSYLDMAANAAGALGGAVY